MNVRNHSRRKVVCTDKYDTSPFGCDYELLEVGKEYTVTNVDMGGFVTMITLEEFPDKEFNSVLFGEIGGTK